jgi:hypothetical protein
MEHVKHKQELLALIRRAKSSHIRWRSYAQGLIGGVPVDEDRLPIKHTDCRFGQWYFGEGTRDFGHLEIFKDLAGPHEMLHALYAQIHELVGRGKMVEAEEKLQHLVGRCDAAYQRCPRLMPR